MSQVIEEKIERTVGGHWITYLKLTGEELLLVDGISIDPKCYRDLENEIRRALQLKLTKSSMTFDEIVQFLYEKLADLATTEDKKLLVKAYEDCIRPYAHRIISELLLAGKIKEGTKDGRTIYWV